MSIRVLLVDDEQLVRAGFRLILESEPGIEVIAEAGNGREAVELATRLDPDVVLMDIQMPEMNGLEATERIAALKREDRCRVLIVTTFEADDYVYGALRAGASGFLLKRTPAAELIAGVRVVAAGEALLAPSVTRRLIDRFAQAPAPQPSQGSKQLAELTEREREVLLLIARGLSNQEIADSLVVAEGTVKTHVKRIFMKLDLHDRVQAVIFAYEAGLVGARS
jgi:DNA-binding NarL/FixJ family response regulator